MVEQVASGATRLVSTQNPVYAGFAFVFAGDVESPALGLWGIEVRGELS